MSTSVLSLTVSSTTQALLSGVLNTCGVSQKDVTHGTAFHSTPVGPVYLVPIGLCRGEVLTTDRRRGRVAAEDVVGSPHSVGHDVGRLPHVGEGDVRGLALGPGHGRGPFRARPRVGGPGGNRRCPFSVSLCR